MSNENCNVAFDTNGNRIVIKAGGTLRIEDQGVIETTKGLGAKGGSVTAVTEHIGTVHKTILTLTAVVIATVDATTNGAQGTLPLYTFPAENIIIHGATLNVTTLGDGTGITTTSALISSIGTVAAAADVTLTGTEANIVPSNTGTLAASIGAFHATSTGPLSVDSTATPVVARLNIVAPDAGSTANGTVTVTGTITIVWISTGASQ